MIYTITDVCAECYDGAGPRKGFWEDVILQLLWKDVQFRGQHVQRQGGRRKHGTLEVLQKFQLGTRKGVCVYVAVREFG